MRMCACVCVECEWMQLELEIPPRCIIVARSAKSLDVDV